LGLRHVLLQILVHHVLQVLRNLEDRHVVFIDHHLFAGARIAGHPPFSLLDLEASESAYLDVLSRLQGVDDGGDESVNDRFGLDLRQAGCRRNDVYDVCFSQ